MAALEYRTVAALALCLTLGLSACGGNDGEESAGTDRPAGAGEADAGAGEVRASDQPEEFALGAPRDDLQRFYGVYGDPDNPGRDFFVAAAELPPGSDRELPEGYLMIGAMWGDVAPWYMRSVSDTRFEQQWVGDFGRAKIVEFEPGDGGQAQALTFETVFDDRGRLQRLSDLPERWR